jgi:hypothetical protein
MINYEEESIVDKENQVLNELDVLNKMPNNSEIDNQEDFNHLDFVWSPIAAERIYRDKVLPLLKQYNV